jgi:hypothetical protein
MGAMRAAGITRFQILKRSRKMLHVRNPGGNMAIRGQMPFFEMQSRGRHASNICRCCCSWYRRHLFYYYYLFPSK